MNLIAVLLQEAAEAEGGIFSLDLGVSFWTFVIFLVLMVVLSKYAFPPIIGYAEARERRIQESLDEARRTREEAGSILEEQRRELDAAREEAKRIIAEARQGAERVRQDMVAEAREEQEQILKRAQLEIGRERVHAVETLKREAVELSLAAATKLVGRRMDAAEDRRLVQEFLAQAGDAAAAGGGAGAGASGGAGEA